MLTVLKGAMKTEHALLLNEITKLRYLAQIHLAPKDVAFTKEDRKYCQTFQFSSA